MPGKKKAGSARKKSPEPKKRNVGGKPSVGTTKVGTSPKEASAAPPETPQQIGSEEKDKVKYEAAAVAEKDERKSSELPQGPEPTVQPPVSPSVMMPDAEEESEYIGDEDNDAPLLDENESLQPLFDDGDEEEGLEGSTTSVHSGIDLEETPVASEVEPDVMIVEEVEEEEEEEFILGPAEEEEENATEMVDEVQEQPPPEIQDDPDNIANLMMVGDEEENEGIELLFMETGAVEADVQSIATFPGVVGLNLKEQTLSWLEMKDLAEMDPPQSYISFKRVKLHIYMHQEASEFYPFRELLTYYPDFAILIGVDTTRATGHSHFMCTSLEGRNMVLHPPKAKKKQLDVKKKEEEMWKKLASLVPRKWRSLGSEVEVELEAKYTERPLITMHAYRYFEAFHRPCQFTDTGFEKNKNAVAGFESLEAGKVPLLEISEMDVAIQVMPQKTASATQTGFSFKRNKISQYENQFLDPESVKVILQKSADSILKKTKALQRALLQNELMNLPRNDYMDTLKALKGHDVDYNEQSVILEEYHTYFDMIHSKGRCVTWMQFHPALEDVLVIALGEDVTLDKRIDFHSKSLMDPNFVLFWDLKDPTHPQIMLDAPAAVFCFTMNPSDPQIVCGGCANGQVVLWDLGREYVQLRARLQDRGRKIKDKGTTRLHFLDKLKDTAEKKYSCPLIVPVGLSNLDQSHNKIVTSVCWLPSHVELGKNGSIYENAAGKSFQFFSTAGDGTVRVWDIRPPRLGMDDYDAIPSDIRSNVYLHLENNNWRHSNKYFLEDGNGGTLLATILSLSEPRHSDIVAFDTFIRHDTAQLSGSSINATSGGSEGKAISDKGISSHKSDHSRDLKSREALAHSGTVLGDQLGDSDYHERSTTTAGIVNVLASVQSSIFIGTETGDVGLVDWLKNKDGPVTADAGQRVFYNIFIKTVHDGSITSISRSPFHFNLILVVGGGTVSIWKETSTQPLLAMSGREQFPWCGVWSNTRPAVFFIGTREGALEVWDLTEKSNAPVLLQQISQDRITNVAIPRPKLAKQQFLALSDSTGSVFVMILSGYYSKPNKTENAFMIELITREEKRQLDWAAEAETRHERMELINNNWKESKVVKTEEEITTLEIQVESRLNAEYIEFVEFEAKLASRLKLDEPSLSNESLEVDVNFDELYKAAQNRVADGNESGTEEEEDDDNSPLGSEYDFLMRQQSSPTLPRKATVDSNSDGMDSH